jgi:hypothetical protein
MLPALPLEQGSPVALSSPCTTGENSSPKFGARTARCFMARNISESIGRQFTPYFQVSVDSTTS